jgi:hypothetical protein
MLLNSGYFVNAFLRRRNPVVVCGVAALGISLLGSYCQLKAQTTAAPVGSAAWSQIGRTALNPTTGAGFAYGYYTQIAGITSSVFSGAPSEATAFFTFRSSQFQLVPVKTNGDINMALVLPDTFNVYLNTSPHADWSNPDSFSSGTIVATFSRAQFLLLRIWESFGTEYCALTSSQDFTFNNATVNFGKVYSGVTLTSTYSNAPLPPLPGFAGVIAFAGQGIIANGPSPSPNVDPGPDTPQ